MFLFAREGGAAYAWLIIAVLVAELAAACATPRNFLRHQQLVPLLERTNMCDA